MNKTIILAAAIIAFGIVAGAYVIGSFDRYAMNHAGSDNAQVYRLDKWTGKSWRIFPSGKEYVVEQMNMTWGQSQEAKTSPK